MKQYNKLVRGKIPEIIEAEGKTAQWHRLDDDQDFVTALLDKVVEEAQELRANPSLEELADVQESLGAAIVALGLTPGQVAAAQAKKAAERGGFKDRIFLESADE